MLIVRYLFLYMIMWEQLVSKLRTALYYGISGDSHWQGVRDTWPQIASCNRWRELTYAKLNCSTAVAPAASQRYRNSPCYREPRLGYLCVALLVVDDFTLGRELRGRLSELDESGNDITRKLILEGRTVENPRFYYFLQFYYRRVEFSIYVIFFFSWNNPSHYIDR